MDKTLLKGLMVLEMVNEMEGRLLTFEELAAKVGLTRSNTHRTLQTLTHAGYVEKDEVNGGYRSTIKMFELGARQLGRLDVRKIASPFMRALAEQTGETIHLSVLDGLDVVYIDKIDSLQPIRAYSMVGGRAPAYAVATGKAMLAAETEGYADRYVESHPGALVRHTPATIATLPTLKVELRKIGRAGYAVNRGEWRDTVGGLAAPVFNGLDRMVCALGISGPLDRLGAARMKQLAPMVMEAAAQLSRKMGYRNEDRRKEGKQA